MRREINLPCFVSMFVCLLFFSACSSYEIVVSNCPSENCDCPSSDDDPKCDEGYKDYGDGECRPVAPCGQDTTCKSENRKCINNRGIALCGNCLAGYEKDEMGCKPITPNPNDDPQDDTSQQPPEKQRGLALAFDDDFVEQWGKARHILKKFGARVTFFVTRPGSLTEADWETLLLLQQDGHHIAHHSLTHLNPREFLQNGGRTSEYVAQEVLPAKEAFSQQGFNSSVFAYPWGGYTPALLARIGQEYNLQRISGRVKHGDKVFFKWKGEHVVSSAAVDEGKSTDAEIHVALQNAAEKNWVLLAHAHRILEQSNSSHITIARLENILRWATDLDLEFYTYEDLVKLDPARNCIPEGGEEIIYDFLDEGSVSVADQIVDFNIWDVNKRFEPAQLGEEIQWTEDPYNENYWRFLFYSLRPTRHLLYSYLETGDSKYLNKLVKILDSFVKKGIQAEPLRDPHASAFLVMVLTNSYHKLRLAGVLDDELADGIRNTLHDRGIFLAKEENFEADYNHGVTQAAALMLLSHAFSDLDLSQNFREIAAKRLELIVSTNLDEDGVQVEQSPFYHFYVMNFFWQIHRWNGVSNAWPSSTLEDSIPKMIAYANNIVHPDGSIPLLASSTQLNIRTSYKSIYSDIASSYPEYAYVLSGGQRGQKPEKHNALFRVAGISSMRSPYGDVADYSDQSHVVFDVGPYRTTHSHLDALNFTYFAHGLELITDPGLYSYESSAKRSYYVSTSAHNTVVVDGKNQKKGAPTIGEFIEEDSYTCQYADSTLYDEAEHRRRLCLVEKDTIVIVDHILSRNGASHQYEQLFHLNPSLFAFIHDGVVVAAQEDSEVRLRIFQLGAEPATIELLRGSETPRQGWVSVLYEKEVPATVVKYSTDATDAVFVTVLSSDVSADAPILGAQTDDSVVIIVNGRWGPIDVELSF